jgi:hypothetical protein
VYSQALYRRVSYIQCIYRRVSFLNCPNCLALYILPCILFKLPKLPSSVYTAVYPF